MNETEKEFWNRTHKAERNNILKLNEQYFSKRGCWNFSTTSKGYSCFDLVMLSAYTTSTGLGKMKTVMVEYKNRNISIGEHPTSILEKPKYLNLLDFHNAGNTVLYIADYLECFVIFNLSVTFEERRKETLENFFRFEMCQRTSYDRTKVQKEVTDFLFNHPANIYIDKNYKRIEPGSIEPYLTVK